MGLIRKTITPRLVAASRANGRRSRGPKTELGKMHSSRNSGKHLIYAEILPWTMKQLGENPVEFEKLQESLSRALKPQDEFEAMLVKEIAQNRWRRQRLMRAESGILANRIHNYQKDRIWSAHMARRELRKHFEAAESAVRGYSAAPECPEKFARIIDILDTIRTDLLLRGLSKDGLAESVKVIYGADASCLGNRLVSTLQAVSTDFEKRSPVAKQVRMESLMKAIDEEIEFFERELDLYQTREVDVTDEMKDALMLPPQEDLEKILRYGTALEREFQRKLQQFVAWRRAKGDGDFSGDHNTRDNSEQNSG